MFDKENPVAAQPEHFRRVSFIRVLVRALGVTFLSALSLLAAFYAFLFLPQVQDLFFDVRPYAWQGVVYWLEFYLLTILVWAVPLAFTARLLLLQNFQAIGVDTQTRFNWIVLGLPSLYLVLTSIAVFLGLIGAVNNLPSPTVAPHEVCSSASQNGAVLGICAEKPLYEYLKTHLTILFIASAIAFFLLIIRSFFAQRYYRHVEKLEASRSGYYRKFLLKYELLSRKHVGELTDPTLYLLSLKPRWMRDSIWIASQRAKVFMCTYLLIFIAIFLLAIIYHYAFYFEPTRNLITKTGFLSSQPLSDIFETLSIRRASFVPIALGAWVPFVSFLALLSNRFQAPIIASLVLIATLLTFVTGDGHDPRLKAVPERTPSLTLAQAIKTWRAANGCGEASAGPSGAAATNCPRPIIASGEGGGSRAAYLMASTLGHLEDLSLDSTLNKSARRFSQQLFGISAVSGSSVGAAMFLGALQVHGQANRDEIKKGIYAQRLYFLNAVNTNNDYLGNCVTYKDSLQAILSNDFISSTVGAFLARDLLTVSRLPFVMDRAGVLESSWEMAFSSVYGKDGPNPLDEPLKTFQAGVSPQSSGRLLSANANGASPCGSAPPPAGWVPILFANATSGESGRRAILSPIDWKDRRNPERNAFSDSYDFDELICSDQPPRSYFDVIAAYLPSKFSPVTSADCDPLNGKMRATGLRLSTAAGISSRSPFVSPHASVRDQNGRAIDSLVDGGYFDNSGAVTAYELAQAIKRIDPSLDPFVLEVTSEPDWFADSDNCEEENKRIAARQRLGAPTVGNPQLPYQSGFKPLGAVGDALTVNSTRIARGFETMVQMPARMEQLNRNDIKDSYAQVYVCPQQRQSGFAALTGLFPAIRTERRPATFREITSQHREHRRAREKAARENIKSWKQVSLSWWLSPPLQAYLDGQVYADHNAEAFRGVLDLLAAQDSGKPLPQ